MKQNILPRRRDDSKDTQEHPDIPFRLDLSNWAGCALDTSTRFHLGDFAILPQSVAIVRPRQDWV